MTGAAPIKVKWVDQRKGEDIRARLVAMELRKKYEAAIFAGTPSPRGSSSPACAGRGTYG